MNGVPVWWKFLHQPGILPLWGNHSLFIFYPFLPWAGLAMLGYCCGKLFAGTSPEQRKKILMALGAAAVVFFVIVRTINIYGNPAPWNVQKNSMATFFSFMNVQKYPPSLLFLCATMGPVLLFLAFVKNSNSKLQTIIKVYGRVPLFYFIVHFFILRAAQVITYFIKGHSIEEGMKGIPGVPFKFVMPGEGYNLFVVYGIWILVVIIMYPLCKKYDDYKIRHKEKWWLSYL